MGGATPPRPLVPGRAGRAALLLSWLVGGAMLAGVIVVALHWPEERAAVLVARHTEPWWMAAALLLQACTYPAQGAIWRVVARARGVRIGAGLAWRLSLAKLFIDQALPSAGLSGTVVAARVLEEHGVGRGIVMAAMVIDGVAYYAAYVAALLAALVLTASGGRTNLLFLPAAMFLATFSVLLGAAALAIAGRRELLPARVRRMPLLGNVIALLTEADPLLVRSPALLLRAGALQLAIVLLDAATIWVLLASLGEAVAPTRVFVSFMASSLLRTVSAVPGGLGVFEAASVVTLQQAGIPVPVALGATLMFRGLSFWLPMAPGIWYARRLRVPPVPARVD